MLSSPTLNPSSSIASRLLPWQFRLRPALFVTVSSIAATLVVFGGLISARRLAGAIQSNLNPSSMLLLALISAAAASFARIAWRRSFPLESPAKLTLADQLVGWGSSLGLVLLGVGCCYPGDRTSEWLIWLPILVADQFWRQTFFDAGEPQALMAEAEDFSLAALNDETNSLSPDDFAPDDNIVQQLYRLQGEQGQEIIYGTVRADFVTGQRTAVVHVGFCPPLEYLPEIEAEALPGSYASIKVVQAFAHGTRLDVRLPSPAIEDCQLWIDMAARPVATSATMQST